LRTLTLLLLLPLAAWLALCVLLFLGQRSQIYFPVPESDRADAAATRLPVDGAVLKVWSVARPGPRALVYFGGNAEDVAQNIPGFAAAFPGHSLYLVNYRGYGGSSGSPSEAALLADAEALFDRLRPRHAEISVIGRSLGSGVAAHLASVREVHRLVLVTPFDSLARVAAAHFRWLPVRWLMRDRYDSASRAPAIRAPVLAIVAGADEIVPHERSAALVAAFPPAQVEVLRLEGLSHNDVSSSPRYLASMAEFLRDGPR
jgi:hypothetical protein